MNTRDTLPALAARRPDRLACGPTIERVDFSAAVALAGATGLGLGALLAWSRLRRRGAVGAEAVKPSRPAVAPTELSVADVLALLPGAAILVGRDDAVVGASQQARVLGLVRGDRIGNSAVLDLVHGVQRDASVREAELELPRGPLGTGVTIVAVRVAPLGPVLVLVTVADLTEARRVEAVRRDFVANVSHELKTPVGALSLLAEAVAGAAEDPEGVRRFAGQMQREAARLGGLVQDLIDLSRLQGQDPLANATEVELDAVVYEAVDRCRTAAAAKQIELVRGGASGLTVRGDERQLVTAVRNLVDNAVAYSPERTRVVVGLRAVEDVVEVSVTDEGIGIPTADLDRVFERFYRVDPARSRATGGTGLGLSIVKHVAVNHGGQVRVWSQEGVGSTFTVRLPLACEPARTVPQEAIR